MCIHMENFRDLLFQRKTGFRGRQEKMGSSAKQGVYEDGNYDS